MQVSVETTSGLGRKMTIQIPSDEIESEISKKLKDLSNRVRIDGFRPGKAPLKVIKQRYDGQVRQQVLEEVIQKSLNEAIVQENIRMAGGAPHIEPKNIAPGENLEFFATFEVYPEIELATLDDTEIEKQTSEVVDQDVDNLIEKLQVQHVTWDSVERPAKEEDQVIINFVGKIDGVAFEGGAAESTPLVLGSNMMIEGFEAQIIGASSGENRTIQVTFPEDYGNAELAGKQADFEIEINSVSEPKLPELNEDFVKSFGIMSGDLSELKKDIRENMQRELAEKIKKDIKNKILEVLVEKNNVEIPRALIDSEISTLVQQLSEQKNQALPSDEELEKAATSRVKTGLLVAEVIRVNKLEANQDKIEEILQNVASTYDDADKFIESYRQNKNAMQSVESFALEETVVDFLLSQVKVKQKPASFDEIMNQ